MPRKPKTRKTAPTITVKAPEPIPDFVPPVEIRCIWDSRLIVGADKTPSGTRYDFNPNQVGPVEAMDYQYLLDMSAKAPGCCGGYGGSPVQYQKFFEAV